MKMKKVIALILALVYLSTTSGMVMNVQYCFDKVSSVQVNGFGDKDGCCCIGAEKTAGCCSDEVEMVKLHESHQAAFANYSIENPTQLLSIPLSYIDSSPIVSVSEELVQISDSSPPLPSAPIYIKNCVFRI